jgi:3-deoxy-D-manno-octulosonic-acid transferase
MIHGVYTAVLAGLIAAYAPVALGRKLTRGVPLNLRARLGFDPRPRSGRRPGWIHAVSVGESIAAVPLATGLRRRYPQLPLVMTTVTETGAQVVRQRLDELVEHRYFPLDLPRAVGRVVDAIDPAFLICMETELWPNLLRRLHARGVPVMIANGRLSDRSFRRYTVVRSLLRPMLKSIQLFAMQSEEDARRIIALGAPADRVVVTGNMKHDVVTPAADQEERWRRCLRLDAARRVWMAGSTHPGEEEAVLDAHALAREGCPDLALIVAPRHPERATEVVDLVRARGWPVVRRSALVDPLAPDAAMIVDPPAQDTVIVLDTVGELAGLYAVADVVFVGGSLVPRGGQNLLEPARLGKAVLFGPHTGNFREAAALLLSEGGGLIVTNPAELASGLRALLADETERRRMGAAARAAAAGRQGAVGRTLDLVGVLLTPPRDRAFALRESG